MPVKDVKRRKNRSILVYLRASMEALAGRPTWDQPGRRERTPSARLFLPVGRER
jgi:hypothetical protein